jgi:bacterioferritin (cytochrome b1)
VNKLADIKMELVKMLNQALELEHAARIQYLAHAELIKGLGAEEVIGRLKEIASDELKHEEKFRNLIGNYLNAEPSMGLAETHQAKKTKDILEVNLKGEKDAIDFYKQIYKKVNDNKADLQYEFETLEHEIRHVIVDEQEHVTELSLLLGK